MLDLFLNALVGLFVLFAIGGCIFIIAVIIWFVAFAKSIISEKANWETRLIGRDE